MGVITAQGKNGFKVVLEHEGLDFREIEKVEYASQIFADAISSDEFKKFCLGFTYVEHFYKWRWFKKVHTGAKGHRGFESTDLSNKEVYNKIMAGKEDLSSNEDSTANVFLRVDRRNKRNVVGYTYPGTKWQWIYARFLRSDPAMIANNSSHEWCHKLGFGHDYRWNQTRQYSVPYAIGSFVQSFAQK